jgi:hypothetical protein
MLQETIKKCQEEAKINFGKWCLSEIERQGTKNINLHTDEIIDTLISQTVDRTVEAVIEYIRTAFKDQSEIGVNHLNVELDFIKDQVSKK